MDASNTLSVGTRRWELAPSHVIQAMFTTVSCRLEPRGSATRFPIVIGDLSAGYLRPVAAPAALLELEEIAAGLRTIPVKDVVWTLAAEPYDDAREPVNHQAANAFEYWQPIIFSLREGVLESLKTGQVLRIAEPNERRTNLLAGLVIAVLGLAWMGVGRAFFPTLSLRSPYSRNAAMPVWTFGMYLVMFGVAMLVAALSPALGDWFRRHPSYLTALAIILPLVWLVICARAGFLPDN